MGTPIKPVVILTDDPQYVLLKAVRAGGATEVLVAFPTEPTTHLLFVWLTSTTSMSVATVW